MIVRQQRLDPRLAQHCRHELGRDIALDQPLPILGEDRRVPIQTDPGYTLLASGTSGEAGQVVLVKQLS